MQPFDLEPKYSSNEIPGKCIKCLAEQELYNCLRELLREESENKEMQQKYDLLLTFLKSTESQKIRDEAEQYLAEGRKVTLRLSLADGKPKYELNIG